VSYSESTKAKPFGFESTQFGGFTVTVHNQETLPDIRHTVVFNAPIQKVWSAVTTAEGISTWFMPTSDFQAELGNDFTLQSPYGVSPCKVREIDPPNRLVFNWGETWMVTFELKDLEGKTEFTLIHAGWIADKVLESGEDTAVVRGRMDHGWSVGVLPRLAQYVEA
jgi:uncharacterized protein YndB with AHSA1/START domain